MIFKAKQILYGQQIIKIIITIITNTNLLLN